jgi:hypothetical protein
MLAVFCEGLVPKVRAPALPGTAKLCMLKI